MASLPHLAQRMAAVEKKILDAGLGTTASSGSDASTLDGHPASYFAVAGALSIPPQTSAPPAASLANVGQLYCRRAGSGQPTQTLQCQQTSTDGVYEWVIIAQSS